MRTWLAALILAFSTCALAQPAAGPARPLRVALVLPGPITDGTFNSAAHRGMEDARKRFPNVSVSVRENTSMAQTEEAMRAYARDGYDVVIGHGFQFADAATKIHKQFPKTWFIVNTAKVAAPPNLASFDNRWGDAGYVAGAVAAMVSKRGIVGHIGGVPVPVIQEYNEGFERGAKWANPSVRMLSAFVGSFSDVAKGKEITISLIERGADVVSATGNESVIGTLEAAKERKVLMVGTAFDNARFAPDTIVTTALINFNVNLEMAISKVLDNSIRPQNYLLGFNENGVGLAGFGRFESQLGPQNRARIERLIADIKAGKVADLPQVR